ncbi:MAG: PQQ-dependent sugar dehydrogenase [Planctomycetes bacterium]|nr:PQQ-dependent sugar dehydrogenase [Planctomycetota bacterium]
MLATPVEKMLTPFLAACLAAATSTAVSGVETAGPHRQPWTGSRLLGSPEPPPPYRVERVFSQLNFQQPVEVALVPDGERMFVAELAGKIHSFVPGAGKPAELFLDLKAVVPEARQVYGLAFHPDFARNRYCYLCYVLEPNLPEGTRVSRFRVRDTEPPVIDPASELILITWLSGGHNGGCLQFGPDGYLYISTGDGAGPNPPDPLATGQDNSDLLSSILRIDVDQGEAGRPYRIPPDNPFVNQPDSREEIWAYGFRNPWKMSFGPASGELWVGDVGWELWEMVYRVERGGNYGWSITEGPQPVRTDLPRGPTPILPPAAVHPHTEARSITGGYVYRGAIEELRGAYIYGDYVTGKIWALRGDSQETSIRELADTSLEIIVFAEDAEGELYVVDYGGGFYRLAPQEIEPESMPFPQTLSETGLFASTTDLEPAPGVLSYRIHAEPWMDGAAAERFLALPGTSQIDPSPAEWRLPENAVLAKTISMEVEQGDPATLRRLETQILHFDGVEWRGYTYLWNDEQTDAVLAPAEGAALALTVADPAAPGGLHKHSWRFHSRTECLTCHNPRAGGVLAFNAAQLADLQSLRDAGIFTGQRKGRVNTLVDPHDTSAELDIRARSYLHANCAHCHRQGGGGTAPFELKFELPLEKTRALNQRPSQGACGIYAARTLAPGDPYRSVMFYRMATLGRGRMPHLGSERIDEQGLRLIHDWISRLPTEDIARDAIAVESLRNRQRAALSRLSDDSQRPVLIATLLESVSGALMLMHAVDAASMSDAIRAETIAAAASHANPQVRELFERFLPPGERVQPLGAVADPGRILSLTGDADRGRVLFHRAEGVSCRNCHRIGREGKEVGPDLTHIGKKYDRAKLLESILQPSKHVEPQWVSYAAETAAGRVHVGMLVRKTEQHVVLKVAEGEEVHLPAEEIEFLAPQPKSLMPELLLQDMTAQDAADLVAYLSRLE